MKKTDNWWESDSFSENLTAHPTPNLVWDNFFMGMAQSAGDMLSKCSSRQIGACIVKDKQILSFGYNGAPAGVNLCQDRYSCPRRKLGYGSGEGVELCPAQHAERNAITNAAKNGISVVGATLYCACGIPCQQCAGAIVNAGIVEVVCISSTKYDDLAETILREVEIRVLGEGVIEAMFEPLTREEVEKVRSKVEVSSDPMLHNLLATIDHLQEKLDKIEQLEKQMTSSTKREGEPEGVF